MSRYLFWGASLPLIAACVLATGFPLPAAAQDEVLKTGVPGKTGGSLTVALRTEPKTLNPVLSVDAASREVIGAMQADLIHINRETQRTEPALATDWKISPDGKRYTLHLRRGVKFSDGAPFDADDVLFSFGLYLDEKLNSPQRDLLLFNDKPLAVAKLDRYSVQFDLPRPYGAGVRLFDGLAMMPRHLLETPYHEGKPARSRVSALFV
jgi:peptide/nickel transport system substrate-binding protein